MPTLNWHKREEAVRAATRAYYRLLEPVAELSYGDAESENLLIRGNKKDEHGRDVYRQLQDKLTKS